MYKYWPYLDIPDRGATIWRYMVLDRFVSLLKNAALFFATAEKFDNSFEDSGAYTDGRLIGYAAHD